MFGDLLEHVIEKADTGADLDGPLAVQVYIDANLRLPRLPVTVADAACR